MGTGTAIVASAVIGAISSQQASKQQSRGIRGAAAQQSALQQQLIGFQERILEEGRPFREAAGRALPFVEEDVLTGAGGSPLFQRGLQRGIEGIRAGLSGAGLADSSVAGRAIGEFTTGATAQETEAIRRQRFGLLGLQGTGLQQAGGLFGGIGGAAGALGGLGIAGGALRAGTTSALGGDLSQLALLFGLQGGGGGAQVPAGFGGGGIGTGAGVGGGSASGAGAGIDPFSTTGAGAGVSGVRRRKETGINRVGRRRLR